MEKLQAVQIIEKTFKSAFNEIQFTHFVRNLFNEIDEDKAFTMEGSNIPEAYKNHVKIYKRIATYCDPDGYELDILIVNLIKDSSIERARSMQRNFLAWYLKNSGQKEAALVAYYTEGLEDWRFSYVRMEYHSQIDDAGKIKTITDLTPARRYSFLVGKNEPNHTAQQQLVPLLQDTQNNPSLAQIEHAFNIESVTKEFFKKYRLLFDEVDEHIEKELKKSKQLRDELASKHIEASSFTKKLLGQIVFLYFIQKKGWLGVPKTQTWGAGDRQFLRTLLQNAISTNQNFYSEYLEFLFYDALAKEHRGGSDASYYPKFDCKIPFLNGGLFEADYDWKKFKISLPNTYFTNTNKTEEGDIGDGILDIFDRYNFTVKEDEPLEKEVAVDPEMLGKVFENLLEVKDRKSNGAFYTPREVVHYMCQEALINYLDVSLNGQQASYLKLGDSQIDVFGNKANIGQLALEQEISDVIISRDDIEIFILHGSSVIENDLHVEMKGIVTDKVNYKMPASIRIFAKKLDKALEDIRICDPAIGSGAFPVGMMNEIVQARHILLTYTKEQSTIYNLKRHAIQECIYGVDIDHSAIDIAKLRLWLSLVVDEEDFYKIKPLPNLDYKIVEGNSLINLPYNSQQMDTVEKLKEEYFDETDALQKTKLRAQIDHEISDILKKMSKQAKIEINFDFKLYFSEVFRKKNGFDILIGNPPYITVRNQDEDLKLHIKKYYAHSKSADLYVAFLERGLNLLRKGGNIIYIMPNKFFGADYGKAIRSHLNNPQLQINTIWDLKDEKVFENALISTIVFSVSKSEKKRPTRLFQNNKIIEKNDLFDETGKIQIEASDAENSILNKINANKRLVDFAEVRTGIMGFEYWKMEKIISNKGVVNSRRTRIYTNGNFNRYVDSWATEEINLYKKKYEQPTIELSPKYLNNNTIDLFNQNPKILVRGVAQKVSAIIDSYGSGLLVAVHAIKPHKDSDIVWLLGVLNSKLINWYHLKTIYSIRIPQGSLKYPVSFFNTLPIVEPQNKKEFAKIVNSIISTKSRNKNSDTSIMEREIDKMVYEMYDLSEEEIATIEDVTYRD